MSQVIQKTKEAQFQLNFIRRLKKDPAFFIENFLYIRPKGKPLQKFKLNFSQKVVVDQVKKDIEAGIPLRYIICKNRQVGLSTLSEALIFWATIFNPSYASLLVTPDREKSQELFQISQMFYDRLPKWLQPMKHYRTKNNLIFANPDEKTRHTNPGLGSSMSITQAKNLTAPRGKPLSAVHLSEVPYYDFYMFELFPTISSAIPPLPNTLIIMESTPKGKGGFFYEQYMLAKLKDHPDPDKKRKWNGFTAIFLPWYIDQDCRWPYELSDPEIDDIMSSLDDEEEALIKDHGVDVYQLKWRRYKIGEYGDNVEQFHLENPTTEEEAFSLSGTYMFTPEARKYYEDCKTEGIRGRIEYGSKAEEYTKFVEDPEGYVEIFKPPKLRKKYSMGVDPAYGKGQDYSAIVVLSEDFEVCATFYCNTMPPELFAEEIVKMGKLYHNALLILETTGPGNGIMYMLRKKYPANSWWKWEQWDAIGKRSLRRSVGWDAINRAVSALDTLLSWAINKRILKMWSIDLINELSQYQYDPDRERGAAPWDEHDDLVRALGLALIAIEQQGVVGYIKQDKTPGSWLPEEYEKPNEGEEYLW